MYYVFTYFHIMHDVYQFCRNSKCTLTMTSSNNNINSMNFINIHCKMIYKNISLFLKMAIESCIHNKINLGLEPSRECNYVHQIQVKFFLRITLSLYILVQNILLLTYSVEFEGEYEIERYLMQYHSSNY